MCIVQKCVSCERNIIIPNDDTQTPAFHEVNDGRGNADLIAGAITRMNALAIKCYGIEPSNLS